MSTTSTGEARIVVIAAPRHVETITRPLPPLGDGDVLVAALRSGISHGTEMNVYRGLAPQWRKRYDRDLRLFVPVDAAAPAEPPARGYWTAGDTHWDYPLAYGYANVGRVERVGRDVRGLRPGDLVYAYQPHQSRWVVPAAQAIPLPELADPAIGVLYSNLNTAYGGVLDADIRLDDTVVVFGQGLVGLLVLQYLKHRSAAARVVTVEGIPHRRDLSRRFGADLCLDPGATDVALEVRRLTGNRGADVVIEASGSYHALQEAIRTAAPNTTVVALSWYGGTGGPLALSDEFHHNRVTVKSSQVGGIDPALAATHSLTRRAEHVRGWFADLDLAPLITDVVPFADAARAYDRVDHPAEETVQVVLAYD